MEKLNKDAEKGFKVKPLMQECICQLLREDYNRRRVFQFR